MISDYGHNESLCIHQWAKGFVQQTCQRGSPVPKLADVREDGVTWKVKIMSAESQKASRLMKLFFHNK
jgi:hypothetical protein